MHTTTQRPIMQLSQTAPPTTLAVSVVDAKRHLNIEVGESHYDIDIEAYLRAAQEYVEEFTNLTLFDTNFVVTWNRFPESNTEPLTLPVWPIDSISQIEYINEAGSTISIDENAGVQSSFSSSPAFILPLPDQEWPATQVGKVNAVSINFTAGYGATSLTVPHRIKQAIKLLVGHWFKNREAVLTGTISKELELAVHSLLNQIRVNEFVEFQRQ